MSTDLENIERREAGKIYTFPMIAEAYSRRGITYDIGNGIHTIKFPKELDDPCTYNTAHERIFTKYGATVITYPNFWLKVAYGKIRRHWGEKTPPYPVSVGALDEFLLGMEPGVGRQNFARYGDSGRGGGVLTALRSLDYLFLMQKRLREKEGKGLLDPLTEEAIEQFGVGGCIPFTTITRYVRNYFSLPGRVDFINVPGTSFAEGYIAILRRWGIGGLPEEIIRQAPWILQNDQGTRREMTSRRLADAFQAYIADRYCKDLRGVFGLPSRFRELRLEVPLFHPDEISRVLIPHPDYISALNAKEARDLLIYMIYEHYYLGNSKEQSLIGVLGEFARRLFNHSNPHSHLDRGSQDDASEIVARTISPNSLADPYWDVFCLFGDGRTSLEQLFKQAELLKELYPESAIYVLLDQGNLPFVPDLEDKQNMARFKLTLSYILKKHLQGPLVREFQEYMLWAITDNSDLEHWQKVREFTQSRRILEVNQEASQKKKRKAQR